jgi:hypothetical protein
VIFDAASITAFSARIWGLRHILINGDAFTFTWERAENLQRKLLESTSIKGNLHLAAKEVSALPLVSSSRHFQDTGLTQMRQETRLIYGPIQSDKGPVAPPLPRLSGSRRIGPHVLMGTQLENTRRWHPRGSARNPFSIRPPKACIKKISSHARRGSSELLMPLVTRRGVDAEYNQRRRSRMNTISRRLCQLRERPGPRVETEFSARL